MHRPLHLGEWPEVEEVRRARGCLPDFVRNLFPMRRQITTNFGGGGDCFMPELVSPLFARRPS